MVQGDRLEEPPWSRQGSPGKRPRPRIQLIAPDRHGIRDRRRENNSLVEAPDS